MTKDETLKLALDWAYSNGETVFAGGGMKAVDGMNAWTKAIREALAQPEQEPVVWMYQDKSTHEVRFQKHMRGFVDHGATYETPLYTTPPQRKPLTDERIFELASEHQDWDRNLIRVRSFARAIEAAHGIGEKK